MKTGFWVSGALAIGMAVALALTGCDSAEGVDGIQVSPESVTLTSTNNTVVFAAKAESGLALPLEWSVANSSLGTINYSSGSNAVYIASTVKKGNQVVIVKDQYGNEGYASVVQQ